MRRVTSLSHAHLACAPHGPMRALGALAVRADLPGAAVRLAITRERAAAASRGPGGRRVRTGSLLSSLEQRGRGPPTARTGQIAVLPSLPARLYLPVSTPRSSPFSPLSEIAYYLPTPLSVSFPPHSTECFLLSPCRGMLYSLFTLWIGPFSPHSPTSSNRWRSAHLVPRSQGVKQLVFGSTKMNRHSSRSHAICILKVTSRRLLLPPAVPTFGSDRAASAHLRAGVPRGSVCSLAGGAISSPPSSLTLPPLPLI